MKATTGRPRPPPGALDEAFARVAAAASGLAGVERSTSYGTPALKTSGRMFARLKDEKTLVLACEPGEKEVLLAAAPDLFFETDHYRGWPLILLRLEAAGDEDLAHHVRLAWGRVRGESSRSRR